MSEEILKIIADLADYLEAAALNIKQKIAEITGTKESVAVKEETFTCLKFEIQHGARLGDYEIAYKEQNLPEHWNHAYNILKLNNATINNRYHGGGYQYSYWLYGGGRIYRKKLTLKQS